MRYILTLVFAVSFSFNALAQSVPCSRTYTADADFDEGMLANVNHDMPFQDQIQLNSGLARRPFPYIWVACSNRGTVVRIDVNSGEIKGEYWTSPTGKGRNPSRTTVDHIGNMWVTNRGEIGLISGVYCGSVTKIGIVVGGTRVNADGTPDPSGKYLKPPFQYCTAVDRNGDGLIHTSMGLGDILAWDDKTDGDGGITARVEDADDECILIYQRLPNATGTRHCSVDPDNNIWVGGYSRRWFHLLNNEDGEILDSFNATPYKCGGYGGLVDKNGIIWSTGNDLLRYDPVLDTGSVCKIPGAYGIGVDPNNGDMWVSSVGIYKVSPGGIVYPGFPKVLGSASLRGVLVTSDQNVWTAASYLNQVFHLTKEGNLLKAIDVGREPTGVAVDLNGKIWVTNLISNNAQRIDPAKGADGYGEVDMTVDLGANAGPYNYSDMTGAVGLINMKMYSGTWTIIKEGCTQNSSWGAISWNALTPPGTSLQVKAHILGSQDWIDVTNLNGISLCGKEHELVGKSLEICVTFLGNTEQSTSPVLYDLTVEECMIPHCNLVVPNEMTPVMVDSGITNNTLVAVFQLENTYQTPYEYQKIELVLPNNMGVYPVPGTSLERPGSVLLPGEYIEYEFPLIVHLRGVETQLYFIAYIYDKDGKRVRGCSATMIVRKVFGLSCSTQGPARIIYDIKQDSFTPTAFEVSINVKNHYDTLFTQIECLLDNSSAPHLRLVPPHLPAKIISYIQPNTRRQAVWKMEAIPPLKNDVVDTLYMSYRTSLDSLWRTCMLTVPIVTYLDTTRFGAECSIAASDTFTLDTNSLSYSPFVLTNMLTNTGNVPLGMCRSTVQLPSYITTTDSLTQSSPPLLPGTSFAHSWTLSANTSAYARGGNITIATKDLNDSILTECTKNVFLPSALDMTCSATDTVTLVFDEQVHDYTPNPFSIPHSVNNHLDTLQTGIEMIVDLSHSPHVLISGVQPDTVVAGVISPRSGFTHNWWFRALPVDTVTTEIVYFGWRSANHQEWRTCASTVIIPAIPKTYSASCDVRAVDSVWLNSTGEFLIPLPFQTAYTVTNTGTGTLHNAVASIHVEQPLVLFTGESPDKILGIIESASSATATWMLGVPVQMQSLGSYSVSFSFSADELGNVPCNYTVFITQSDQINPAVQHVTLYFNALKDGPLPSPQQTMVYAGIPSVFPWTAQGYPAWLDVSPSGSPATETVTVVPNTTSMPLGRYSGTIDVVSSAPNSPKSIAVIYDIHNIVGVNTIANPSDVVLFQNYPNPSAGSAEIPFFTSSSCPVTLTIYNALGIVVFATSLEAHDGLNSVSVHGLQPGLYIYALRSKRGTESRMMVVR